MRNFEFTSFPGRAVFGSGTVGGVTQEVERLGINSALILTTPGKIHWGERISKDLGPLSSGVFAHAAMHTPVTITEKAMRVFERFNADGIVSIGGGSSIGLGKAIALRTDAPQVVLPTTYAGSEMTALVGQSKGGQKTTQQTPKVLPETVIYDVDLTMTLPISMSVASGLNAIAHAVEALYAKKANPVLSLLAEEAVESITPALSKIIIDPKNKKARWDALYGAWLCGMCIGVGGIALHHKLCHVLAGLFDLPHAETHAIILPHALTFNESVAVSAMKRLRRATGSDAPAALMQKLVIESGNPTSLKALGMPESGIDKAVNHIMSSEFWNPRAIEENPLRNAIRAAWAGAPQ